jgi:aspartate/methionine/tyrosine aminotransferase
VPEPRALLREVVADLVQPDFKPFYVSAFAGGNPVAIEILAARYGVGSEQVLCTAGATSGLSLLFRTFGRPGDHALVETPGFDLFHDLAADRGVAVEGFRRRAPDYAIDPAEVEAKLRPGTRFIILSNLHNPSGMALDYGVLRQLGAIAEKQGALLIVDEVYGDYADRAVRPCAAAALSPAIVSVSSLTKIFGLATLRCGWIVGAASVIDALRDVDSRLEFARSNLSHAVATGVLGDPAPFEAYTRDILAASRPIVARWLATTTQEGLVDATLPDAGCIFFPRLVGVDDTEAFARRLIEERGVIVAPGEYFGAPGHVRIGFGLPPAQLEPALNSLTEALRARALAPADCR